MKRSHCGLVFQLCVLMFAGQLHFCKQLPSTQSTASVMTDGIRSLTEDRIITEGRSDISVKGKDHTAHLLVTVGVSAVSTLSVLAALLVLCRLSNTIRRAKQRKRVYKRRPTSNRPTGTPRVLYRHTTVHLVLTGDPQVGGSRSPDRVDPYGYSEVFDRLPNPQPDARAHETGSGGVRPSEETGGHYAEPVDATDQQTDRLRQTGLCGDQTTEHLSSLQFPFYVPLKEIKDRKRKAESNPQLPLYIPLKEIKDRKRKAKENGKSDKPMESGGRQTDAGNDVPLKF